MEKEVLFLKPFIIYSDNVRQAFPVLAYYLKLYALKKGTTLQQKYQYQDDGTSILPDLLKEWQSDINVLTQQLGYALQNPNENKQKILEYTLQIFAKADYEDRNNTFTKETQNNMTLVSRYLEMLAVFGPLTEDLNQKRVYAKAKAVEIKKKLDNPQQNQQRPPNQQQQQQPQQQNNNFNQFQTPNSGSNNNNNNNNNNLARQSVFNHLPTIVNSNNLKTIANNFNDVNIGENLNVASVQKPKDNSKEFQENYRPAAKFVQFANPYLNKAVGFNISQNDAQTKIVGLCKEAISELDFNQFSNAKEALKLALLTIQNVQN